MPPLPLFDLNKIKTVDSPTILFVGKRRTGKTHAMRHVIYTLKDQFAFVVVITETRFNGYWQQYVPEAYIWDDYSAELMRKLLDRQRKLKFLKNSGQLPRSFNMKLLIVFDDVMGLNEDVLRYSPEFRVLFVEGRHFEITTMIAIQDAYGMPPKDRNNIDFAFVFRQQQARNIEAIYDNYMSWIKPKAVAYQIMRDNTRVQTSDEIDPESGQPKILAKWCMVVDWANNFDTDIETLSRFNAEDPGKFRLGCKELWDTSKGWSYDPGTLSKEEALFQTVQAPTAAPEVLASKPKKRYDDDVISAISGMMPHYA